MKEIRIFTGSMDLNSAPEFVAEGNYGKAFNIRNRVVNGGDSGRVSFFNDFVATGNNPRMPGGYNKALKSVVSDKDDLMYVFHYNEFGNHTLVEYSENGNQVLFTNKASTSNGDDLLNWTTDTVLNDMVLHKNKYILVTDMVGEILMFDIEALRTGYGRPLTAQDITLAKAPPTSSPVTEYVDSTELNSNLLLNKLFKFKYKYVYSGGFESAWSASSAELLPSNLNEVTNGITSKVQNLIRVKVKLDHPSITKVVVASSSNGSEWVSIREAEVSYITNLLPFRGTDKDEIYSSGVWEMSFYNPYEFNLLTADDIDHNYDAIPSRANTLDVVNNNVLLLAGLPSGYERLDNLSVDIEPSKFTVPNYSTIVGRGNLKLESIKINPVWGAPYYKESTYIQLSGQPVVGDSIKIICNYGRQGVLNVGGTIGNEETADVFEYTATDVDTTLEIFYGNIARILPEGSVFTDSDGMFVGFRYPDAGGVEGLKKFKTLEKVDIDLKDIGYSDVPTRRTFKRGSTVQFALHYKDAYGRYFPLETNDSFKVEIPTASGSDSNAYGYNMNWTISHNPPIGAVSYQWMVSEDMKHRNYRELIGEFKPTLSKEGKNIVFDLKVLNRADKVGIPGLNYQFNKGDRVYMYTYWASGSEREFPIPEGNNGLELGVIALDVSPITTAENRYLLRVDYNASLWGWLNGLMDDNDKEIAVRLQVFTPRILDPSEQSTVYREIGPTMPIEDGNHSITTGTLESIDDFIRGRVMEAFSVERAKAFLVEDRSVTDDNEYLVPFRGNFRTYYDQLVGRDYSGAIRFSDIGRLNSTYDGINKFFEGRIYGEGPGETTSIYGAIKKIKVVGNYLKVLQEDEVGVIPIYLSIVQDNEGKIQTADSDRLLTTVRYLGGGKVGVGAHANSFAASDRGVIFFFDNDRKIPYRLAGSSLQQIPGRVGDYLNKNIEDSLKGVCVGDSEYWMTVKDSLEGEVTVVFNEAENSWTTFVNYNPDLSTKFNSELYAFKNSVQHIMSKTLASNTFFGTTYPSTIEAIYPASVTRTFKSIEVSSDTVPETVVDGILTEMDHVSDLVAKDFKLNDGVFCANFLRDKATGLFNGKLLKGSWIKVDLKFTPEGQKLDLLKVVINSVA